MLYDAVEIEAIKISIGRVEAIGLSSYKVLEKSVIWLTEKYDEVHDDRYLKKAVWHIYAFLDLGYPYEKCQRVFDSVLERLGEKQEGIFPGHRWRYKRVKLTKGNIGGILGKWNPSIHSMKIDDAINDIINKTEQGEKGQYLYYSGKIVEQSEEKKLWKNTFMLYINEEESILQDINKNIYYMLERKTDD